MDEEEVRILNLIRKKKTMMRNDHSTETTNRVVSREIKKRDVRKLSSRPKHISHPIRSKPSAILNHILKPVASMRSRLTRPLETSVISHVLVLAVLLVLDVSVCARIP